MLTRIKRREFKSVKTWPTWKIEQVLSNDLTMGVDGADFGPIREDLQSELWSRVDKQDKTRERLDHLNMLAYDQWAEKRRVELRQIVTFLKETKSLTYSQTLKLKREIEQITGQETCPFVWAIFKQGVRESWDKKELTTAWV